VHRDERTWEFRDDLAERAMDFAGQMPNIKGKEAGYPLRLMPWQRLVFANLFGFVEPGTSTRRFRQGVVFVPRGNVSPTVGTRATPAGRLAASRATRDTGLSKSMTFGFPHQMWRGRMSPENGRRT
jgi:hypothetical protein